MRVRGCFWLPGVSGGRLLCPAIRLQHQCRDTGAPSASVASALHPCRMLSSAPLALPSGDLATVSYLIAVGLFF